VHSSLIHRDLRGWANNGNTRQYRNKTLSLGRQHWKNISCIFCYSPVCLHCVVPVSMHYRLCLVTVRMKALESGGLVRFLKRTVCWCTYSWCICNRKGHFIVFIQSSSFQGYYGIHKSREDIISCRNSGWKWKVSETYRRSLKTIVSKMTQLLQQMWQRNSIFIWKTLFLQKHSTTSSQIQHPR